MGRPSGGLIKGPAGVSSAASGPAYFTAGLGSSISRRSACVLDVCTDASYRGGRARYRPDDYTASELRKWFAASSRELFRQGITGAFNPRILRSR
jgi:hypothetical protein